MDGATQHHQHRKRVINNLRWPTVLLDGFAHGTWKIIHHRATATLVIEPFELLLQRMRDALVVEGERLVRCVGEGAETFEVRFAGRT